MAVSASIISRQLPPRSVRSFPPSIASLEKDTGNAKSVNSSTTLARRLLFPQLPQGADLPPLLLSDSFPAELHAELYDFFALALRAFINPWWTKITRYDKEFLIQVNSILIDVVRSLESRLSSKDISPLIFRDIPSLISQHYDDYRTAALKLNTSYSVGGGASLPQLFHQFQPHMAITAYGQINEDYVRQYIDFILKACLPPEDFNPDTERYMIREIIVKIVLDVIPRLSQPWFIHKLALDILGSSGDKSTSTNVCRAMSF
jgi:PXA domain